MNDEADPLLSCEEDREDEEVQGGAGEGGMGCVNPSTAMPEGVRWRDSLNLLPTLKRIPVVCVISLQK